MVRRIKVCRCMDDSGCANSAARRGVQVRGVCQGGVTVPGARGRSTGMGVMCGLALGSVAGRAAVLSADDAPVDAAAVRQYNLAVGLQNKKLYAQAAQKWAAFIQGFPKDARLPNAHHYLGICQLQENKLTEAAASF